MSPYKKYPNILETDTGVNYDNMVIIKYSRNLICIRRERETTRVCLFIAIVVTLIKIILLQHYLCSRIWVFCFKKSL